jgi:carbonic anhydrase
LVAAEDILPSLDGLDGAQSAEVLLRAAVEANVRHTVGRRLETPEGKARLATGEMKLVGAVYDLESAASDFWIESPSGRIAESLIGQKRTLARRLS